MSINWHSRRATPDDREAIVGLFKEIFPENASVDHWKWKYLSNPINKMFITVAEDGKRIVGQCALLPTWINLQGRKVSGAQRVDSMVHSDYRKQGMFTTLAQECYDQAAAEGVELLYHFPNKESSPVSVEKLGSHRLGELPMLLKVLNPKAIIQRKVHSPTIAAIAEKPARLALKLRQRKRGARPLKHMKIAGIDTFEERFDHFWLQIKDSLHISVWKDSGYLNWRYFACPDKKYTVLIAEEQNDLIGFIVLRCGLEQDKTGHIVDFLAIPDETATASLISAGLDYLRAEGMDTAICHVFDHSPFHELFINQGFFKYGESFPLLVRPLIPDLTPSTVLDFRQWHLMAGDIDIF